MHRHSAIDVNVFSSLSTMRCTLLSLLFALIPLSAGFAQLPPLIDVDELGDSVPGFQIRGAFADHGLGGAVSGVGDINGDGYEDIGVFPAGSSLLAVEAKYAVAFVIFGGPSGSFPDPGFDVSMLDAASGVVFTIATDEPQFGARVVGVGDVNGDGLADVGIQGLIINDGDDHLNAVVYGAPGSLGTAGVVDLQSLDGGDGVRLTGSFIESMSSAGDVNGDGVHDLVLSELDNVDEVHVVFGSRGGVGSAGAFDLATLNGTNGVSIYRGTGFRQGTGIGDVDGDGLDDIAIGASNDTAGGMDAVGRIFIIFGSSWTAANHDRSADTLNQVTGFDGSRLHGFAAGDHFGSYLGSFGDHDSDGFADFLVGARSGDQRPGGEFYLITGSLEGLFSDNRSLSELPAGRVLRMRSTLQGGTFKVAAAVGDIDGDGDADFYYGINSEVSPFGGFFLSGEAFSFPGPLVGSVANSDVTLSQSNGTHRFSSVRHAGDTNGDGYSDVVFGSSRDTDSFGDQVSFGDVMVLFGSGDAGEATYRQRLRSGMIDVAGMARAILVPSRPVGDVGDRSHSIPLSRCAVGFEGGGRGAAPLLRDSSLQTVRIIRRSVPTPEEGDWLTGGVHWRVDTERLGFVGTTLRFHLTVAELAGMDPTRFGVYFSPESSLSTTTEWTPLQFSFDADTRTFVVVREHDPDAGDVRAEFNGFYTILQGDFEYALGGEIPPPAGADLDQLGPGGPVVEPAGSTFWQSGPRKLWAVREGPIHIEWKDAGGSDLPVEAINTWPAGVSYQTHVASTPPVDVNSGGIFQTVQLMDGSEAANATIGLGLPRFEATGPGRSLLLLSEGNNPTDDLIFFRYVRTVSWDDPAHLEDDVPATIGEPIVGGGRHESDCGGPFVFFENSRHAAEDPRVSPENPGFYNRESRTGPIIPVNTGGEEFVVIYYQQDADGTCWPYKPVRYDPEWPGDAREIVIASQKGSGPFVRDQMALYRQEDPGLPGFNPNEEHALIAIEQGNLPELLLSASEVMVLEGGSVAVELSLLAEPRGDVSLSITQLPGADTGFLGDVNLVPISSEVLISQDQWSTPTVVIILAEPDSDASNGRADFRIRASGGAVGSELLTVHEADVDSGGLFISELAFAVPESRDRSVMIRLTRRPSLTVTVETSVLGGGDADLEVTGGDELIFTRDNWDQLQEIVFSAQDDSDRLVGEATFVVRATGGLSAIYSVTVSEAENDSPGQAVFALRDDLGEGSSDPHVLIKYVDAEGDARMEVFRVIAENEANPFVYDARAGDLIQPPYPLTILSRCEPSRGVAGPYWRDRNDDFWARAAGFDIDDRPANEDIVLQYFYPVQAGFEFPPSFGAIPASGDCIPWLDRRAGTPDVPIDVVYDTSWPEDVPELRVGETVLHPKFGLPEISRQCSVRILYQEAVEQGEGFSVLLFDPLTLHSVPLDVLPVGLRVESDQGKRVLIDLPLSLRERVRFNPTSLELEFGGVIDTSGVGEPRVHLNVMSESDANTLIRLEDPASDIDSARTPYQEAVVQLFTTSRAPLDDPVDSLGGGAKALSAGLAAAEGYVSLAFQNTDDCSPLPVSVEVIRVTCPLYRGEIKVIEPSCAFEEKLTLSHSGDFSGNPDDYEFEWRYQFDVNGSSPPLPDDDELVDDDIGWLQRLREPGAASLTIEGPGLLTLSDNWFTCRYMYIGDGDFACPGIWSPWTRPQLAEGWIKRVLAGINPFDDVTDDYHQSGASTVVSMISRAGPRWEGNVALNCDPNGGFGLIQAYETVLGRGIELSIEAPGGGFEFDAANTALLQAAGRISDLYTLLGNEAYADAQDPTIGFGTTDAQFASESSSLHCFMNQTPSLLEEELALLRGRDDTSALGVETSPIYNRLIWNLTGDIVGGEVAYVLNYNIRSDLGDTVGASAAIASQRQQLEEAAKAAFPQGHGDAWGHYLSAIKSYYRLIRNGNFDWNPRAESVLVAGVPVTVDFFDERKFAKAAAARARCGAEIVSLTHRASYVDDPEGQYQGYEDDDENRAWGLSGWASRAGTGAYLDWVVGNALLPPEDTVNTGVQKIDRTTVTELGELSGRFNEIQAEIDKADAGLNPLGIAKNVVPFDIDPAGIASGETHFEQIYGRAVTAMNNAIAVFNHASRLTQSLRRQQDSVEDLRRTVREREADFNNRLIEMFGTPYEEDIGPGGSYPDEYDGADIYHFTYVDPSPLADGPVGPLVEFEVELVDFGVNASGVLLRQTQLVTFHLSSVGLGLVKPPGWTNRRASGEIQLARFAVLESKGRFERTLVEYDNLLASIESQARSIEAQYGVNAEEISILNVASKRQATLSQEIQRSRARQLEFRSRSSLAETTANAMAEYLATSVGFSTDVTSPLRGAIRLGGSIISGVFSRNADREDSVVLDHEQAKEAVQSLTNIRLTALRGGFAVEQQVRQLEDLVRREYSARLEVYTMQVSMQQIAARYTSTLARGERLLQDRLRFRQQTAADVQEFRYRDMSFRVFRHDALQKYRAQFDLAAMYVYLAANAYDYETNLLRTDNQSGSEFLTDILRKRTIGFIDVDGLPVVGAANRESGLADPMARLMRNWQVLEPQLGFNNPENETNKFSLRRELFRIRSGREGDAVWREILERHQVRDLFELLEFQRYAIPFRPPGGDPEPAFVIPFETIIDSELNFFGHKKGPGDSSYDATKFATKIRSVGVFFSNYDAVSKAAGLAETPRIYLIPVGIDVMRPPTVNRSDTRSWKVLDQRIPTPFPITAQELTDPSWVPILDTLSGNFAEIRRFSQFRAYHDSGAVSPDQVVRSSSRLIGRSVWNTRWLLIIPAVSLLGDRDEGLRRFVRGRGEDGEGVSDITLYFETYAYEGR